MLEPLIKGSQNRELRCQLLGSSVRVARLKERESRVDGTEDADLSLRSFDFSSCPFANCLHEADRRPPLLSLTESDHT